MPPNDDPVEEQDSTDKLPASKRVSFREKEDGGVTVHEYTKQEDHREPVAIVETDYEVENYDDFELPIQEKDPSFLEWLWELILYILLLKFLQSAKSKKD